MRGAQKRGVGAAAAGMLLGVHGLLPSAAPAQARDEGSWRRAGALAVGRYAPGAVLLPDGRALVAGGYSFETNRTHASSEIYDPVSAAWSLGPSLRLDRNFPLVFGQPDGDTLFAMGFQMRGGTSAWVLRFDSRRLRFVVSPNGVEERELAAAAPLSDGRVLIAGGYSTLRRRTLDTAEVYDPRSRRFSPLAAGLRHARFGHAAVSLADGRVLVVGGKVLETNADVRIAELFDPRSETFVETGALSVGRDRVTAWTLAPVPGQGASVLIAGGSGATGGTTPARRCEIYQADTGQFVPGPELVRDRMAHTATLLDHRRVLLVGGWSTSENRTTPQAELWDPIQGRFLPAGSLEHGRHDHAAVRLREGRVLVAGGKEAPARSGIESPVPAEIWTPRGPARHLGDSTAPSAR